MGSYTYCESCKRGLGEPTEAEILIEYVVCTHCGHENTNCFYGDQKEQVIKSLFERLEKLEKIAGVTNVN